MENCEADNVPFEEMFPISSDSVPEEEKRKHHEVLSTYADCVFKGGHGIEAQAKVRNIPLTLVQHSQYR